MFGHVRLEKDGAFCWVKTAREIDGRNLMALFAQYVGCHHLRDSQRMQIHDAIKSVEEFLLLYPDRQSSDVVPDVNISARLNP
jgi:hypothetical protein